MTGRPCFALTKSYTLLHIRRVKAYDMQESVRLMTRGQICRRRNNVAYIPPGGIS